MAIAGTPGNATRLAIQPFGHTGGPWKFIARDDSGKAYLDWVYGSATTGITQDSNGNVGIGTTSPGYGLDVNRNLNQVAGFQSPNPNTWIDINSTAGSWSLGAAANNSMQIYERGSGNQARLTVLNGGNVGIGTISPTYTLQVNGSFSATSKNFDIQDPRYNDPNKRLVHSTLE